MCIHSGGGVGLGAGSVSPGGVSNKPSDCWERMQLLRRGDSQTIIKDGGQRNCFSFLFFKKRVGKDGRKEQCFFHVVTQA